LAPGQTELAASATGITRKLAVQIAKLLGAGRVVAAGRNQQSPSTVTSLYVWGRPTEAFPPRSRPRIWRRADRDFVSSRRGESAGPAIPLQAAALRSSGLEIMGAGSGAIPPMDVRDGAFQQVMTRAVQKELGARSVNS
jgi:hypothetical protein